MGVSKQEIVKALAKELKPVLKKPEWADFVKTGVHKERPPIDGDWWYTRASSMLLKVDKLGPIGVSKLRTKYGGRKNRGVRPEKFYKGSGSIIRKLLQQLESAGLLKQDVHAGHKGRVLTPRAHSLIAQTAKKIGKVRPKAEARHKPMPKMPAGGVSEKVEKKEEIKESNSLLAHQKVREEKNVKVQAKSKEEKTD